LKSAEQTYFHWFCYNLYMKSTIKGGLFGASIQIIILIINIIFLNINIFGRSIELILLILNGIILLPNLLLLHFIAYAADLIGIRISHWLLFDRVGLLSVPSIFGWIICILVFFAIGCLIGFINSKISKIIKF
jgi:hypothetical protein